MDSTDCQHVAEGRVNEALLPASLGHGGWLILNIDYRAHLNLMAINVTGQSWVRQLLARLSTSVVHLHVHRLTLSSIGRVLCWTWSYMTTKIKGNVFPLLNSQSLKSWYNIAWRRFLNGNTNDDLIDCHSPEAIRCKQAKQVERVAQGRKQQNLSFLSCFSHGVLLPSSYAFWQCSQCDLIKKTFWCDWLTKI